jgi:hypothetical protein
MLNYNKRKTKRKPPRVLKTLRPFWIFNRI